MNKVFVIIKEGLGNQIFQLAYGLWQVGGDPKRIVLDTSYYHKHCRHGGYALRTLFGSAKFTGAEVDGLQNINLGRNIQFHSRKLPDGYFEELQSLIGKANIVADGWFQNYSYVAPNIKLLREFYEASASELAPEDADFFTSNTVVGLHFRLNDYLKPNIQYLYGIVNFDAMFQEMRSVVNNIRSDKPVRIAAFSDSPINGPFDRIYVRKAASALLDDIYSMHLMSLCDHLICSNSTFSLWAGYLSRKLKTISLPSPWTRSGIISTTNLLPPNGNIFPSGLS